MGLTHYEQKVIDNLNDISKSLRKIALALERMSKAESVDVIDLATKVGEKIQAENIGEFYDHGR